MKRWFDNILTSGQSFNLDGEEDQEKRIRYIILNTLIFLGFVLLLVFALNSFSENQFVQGVFNFASIGVIVASFLILRQPKTYMLAGIMSVATIGSLYAWLSYTGGVQNSGVFWSFSFPVIAIFVLGRQMGMILSFLLMIWLGLTFFLPNFAPQSHTTSFSIRVLGVYLVVFVSAIVYEQIRLTKDRALSAMSNKLRAERNQIAVMKESVRDAIFLLNSQLIIQPHFSSHLTNLLGQDGLEGKEFIPLLGKSLKEKESESLKDYFYMVIEGTHDSELLREVNPIQSFQFIHPESGELRFYRTSFNRTQNEQGQNLIVVSLGDETIEKQLTLALQEEEAKRSLEMEAFFEIFQVELKLLDHFVEETRTRFVMLNNMLQHRKNNDAKVLSEIFQGLHATKSNAVLLGLRIFSKELHELENYLKSIQANDSIEFELMLSFVVQFEKLQTSFDKLVETHKKISIFRQPQNSISQSLLEDSLFKIHDTISSETERPSQLQVKIDNHPPKEVEAPIREIALQLVRNALIHGLEADRGQKENEGTVRVRLSKVGGSYLLRVSDDGRGIDFDEVLAQARTQGLIQEGHEPNKQELTKILFSEGFSTRTSVDEHAGQGVGLSYVYNLTKKLGGQVKVKTEKAKGTIVEVSVPESSALKNLG